MLKIAYSKIYNHPLPDNHRFPMEKYDLLPEQLLYEGTVTESNFFEPQALDEEIILLTHQKEYFQKLKEQKLSRQEQRRTGFPLSKELVNREIVIMNGTLLAAEYALKNKVAMNIAGGTHHAFSDFGEGFCLLNDIAIAANHLIEKKTLKSILVVDLDVHQGNGTAKIFENNSKVFTFSMHGAKNFPMRKEKSNLDIGLEDGTEDAAYLSKLDYHLNKVVDAVQPEFVFYQCGVDVLKQDKLGRLALSIDGCKQRDKMVIEICFKNRIPFCGSLGGGYSPEIKDILEAHANTFRLIQDYYF